MAYFTGLPQKKTLKLYEKIILKTTAWKIFNLKIFSYILIVFSLPCCLEILKVSNQSI